MSAKENTPQDKTELTIGVPYWAVALIAMAVLEALSFATGKFQVTGNTLFDYDTLTRLAYLRQAIQNHSLNHGFFDRINAPYGMVLHWTLPFNLYMLGVIKLFALIDPKTALQYAGYWAGTIMRAAIGPAAYWAGRRILSPGASGLASILVAFSPYLLVYAHRGTANHHVLMYLEAVLLLGLALRVVLRPPSTYLPLLAGAMAGLCLWTTFEMVLAVGPLFAVLFFLWIIHGPSRLRPLLLVSASFAVTVTIAVLIDPPYGGLGAKVLDHISMPFQTLASIPLLIAIGAYYRQPKSEQRRAAYVFVTGLIAGLVWIACYPFALHGVQGAMDPYVTREWLSQIEEVLPVNGWRKVAAFLGSSLLAIVLVFVWRAPRDRKESMLGGLIFLYVLGQLHFRFVLYAAVATPYFLAYAYERARRNNGEFPPDYVGLARPWAAFVMAVFFVIQISITIFHYDVYNGPDNKDDISDSVTCNPYLVRGPLSDVAWMGVGKKDPIIVNEVNNAAALLYWTDVRTVAGNYHRDSQGIKDDYMFFRDMGDKTAKDIVRKRGADFVLLCGNGNNASYSYETTARAAQEMAKPGDEFSPQETLYTRLTDEEPPPWLKLRDWPDGVDTDLLLYQVDRTKLGK
jgi:hypothetical protein